MIRLVAMLVFAMVLTIPVKAQKGNANRTSTQCGHWYDLQSENTVVSAIKMVKQISTTKNMNFGTHLLVDYKGEELEIHLGPSWYLEKNKIKLRKGDIVKVSGSLVTFENNPSIIAKWIIKESDTIHLRDDRGLPNWAGKGNNKLGGKNRRYKS
ncbi:MAG: hypothetical protein V2I33_21385 [Kangiellaceae bacterium]|jgi:DNA polymerase III alpha subunit|nr:hypothetical protein [Kangiellaceae bacterium]